MNTINIYSLKQLPENHLRFLLFLLFILFPINLINISVFLIFWLVEKLPKGDTEYSY